MLALILLPLVPVTLQKKGTAGMWPTTWSKQHTNLWDRHADWKLNELVNGQPRRPALLTIDAQESLRGRGHYFPKETVRQMVHLLGWFRLRCHPVIFKTWGAGGPDTAMERFYKKRFNPRDRKLVRCQHSSVLAEFHPLSESEHNRTVRSFKFSHYDPQLHAILRSWGVNTVVLVGGFTEHCITATAFAAFDLGMDVVVPADAVGPSVNFKGIPNIHHQAALFTMASAVALVVPNSSVVTLRLSAFPGGSMCPLTPFPAPPRESGGTPWCKSGLGPYSTWRPQGAPSVDVVLKHRAQWAQRDRYQLGRRLQERVAHTTLPHQDDDQCVASWVANNSAFGATRKGQSTTRHSRRLLLVGVPYYWTSPLPFRFEDLPRCFHRLVERHKLRNFNSVLCNIYLQKESVIPWHVDDHRVLQAGKGDVFTISFALNPADRERTLANLRFSHNTRPSTTALLRPNHAIHDRTVELRHGTIVRFDGFEEASKFRGHEVGATLAPRVSLTFRHLKPHKGPIVQQHDAHRQSEFPPRSLALLRLLLPPPLPSFDQVATEQLNTSERQQVPAYLDPWLRRRLRRERRR